MPEAAVLKKSLRNLNDGKRSEFTEAAERFILLLGEKKKERVWERKGLAV